MPLWYNLASLCIQADKQYPSGVPISDQRVEEFRRLYKETHGEDIAVAEAREMANRLVVLYRLLMRPLPSENAPSSAPQAQSTPEEF